jgi:uncharacterized protein YuzE
MKPVRITYDPDGDILYVTFGQPKPSIGYQLSDQILLRVDPGTQKASGLTIFNYSYHASSPRDIPMAGIEKLGDVKPLLLSILGSAPINQFLRVSTAKEEVIATLLSPSLPEAVTW